MDHLDHMVYSYIVSLEGPKADELYSSLGPPSVNKVIIIIIIIIIIIVLRHSAGNVV